MAVCGVGMALVMIMKVLTPSAHREGPCPMSSSPTLTVVDQFDEDEFPDIPAAPAALLAALNTVPDPRKARGLRHGLPGILAIAACAVIAGGARLWPSPNGPPRRPRPRWRNSGSPLRCPANPHSGAPSTKSTPTVRISSSAPGPRCAP